MQKRPDYILLGTILALIIFGVIILASASAPISQEKFGTTYYFLKHQLIFGFLPGLALAFLVFRTRLDTLKKWAPLLLLINLILLTMVFLPKIGLETGGANRWISAGPISFQPSEFLKFTFILYLAAWLSSRTEKVFSQTPKPQRRVKKRINPLLSFIAFLAVTGIISLLLIFQPDISTLGIIVFVAALMYFSANTPLWHNLLIILIGTGGLFALIKLAPYRLARILVFFKPGTDPMGIGYQIKQSLIAVGSGGIFGLGLGMSCQRLGLLPQSISDSIFSIIAEETGFIGSLILIFLFLTFLWRGFKIGKRTDDKFSQLAAVGISSWIVIQAFINISSMIGILPLTGIPLPFISYGGSSMIAELVGAGILLNISKERRL